MKLSLLVVGLVLNYGRCQQENYSGALITSTNMEDSIQEEAIIVTEEALTKSEFWKDRKSHIEQHFDLTYGRKWTCLIGKSSSFSAVLPEMEGMFIMFTVRDIDVILYRTEDLVTQATEKLTTAENRVRSLESLNNKLKDEYTKNVDKLKQELEDRKRAVRRVETSLSDANKKLQSVESDAKIKTNELVQALNDKQAVTNQHSDCTSKLDMLKFQSTRTQEDLTKTITKLTDEKTSLVGRVGQLDARMTQANNEQAVCESQLVTTNNQLRFLRTEKSSLTADLTRCKTQLAEFTDLDKIHERRQIEQPLALFGNSGFDKDEAVRVAKAAVAKNPDLKSVATYVRNYFNTKYASYSFFCLVEDRALELGYDYSSETYRIVFSIQGITVFLVRYQK